MAAIVFNRPAGVIIVNGATGVGTPGVMFAIWPSGLVRQLTAAEWNLWGSPDPDHTVPFGNDAEWNQLVAYDNAVRGSA